MKILKPAQLTGEIINLILEALQYVILISPYFQADYWNKLQNAIDRARDREVDVQLWVRHGESKTIEQAKRLGLQPRTIPWLHAKAYLNEKQGILASVNLVFASDQNAIDLGCLTETANEHRELLTIVEDHILSQSDSTFTSSSTSFTNQTLDIQKVEFALNKKLQEDPHIESHDENETIIQVLGNKFSLLRSLEGQPTWCYKGILASKELDWARANQMYLHPPSGFTIELDDQRNYDSTYCCIVIKAINGPDRHLHSPTPNQIAEEWHALIEMTRYVKQGTNPKYIRF